jgi:hypothetical protein
MHHATDAIHASSEGIAAVAAIVVSTALTGAAVLRATARIFLGASGVPAVELTAPTEREREKGDRPLWLMLLPCVVLLAIALLPAGLAGAFVQRAATGLVAGASPPTKGGTLETVLTFALTNPASGRVAAAPASDPQTGAHRGRNRNGAFPDTAKPAQRTGHGLRDMDGGGTGGAGRMADVSIVDACDQSARPAQPARLLTSHHAARHSHSSTRPITTFSPSPRGIGLTSA